MCTFWVLYALMVRLRFFSFTSSKSVHWNFQTVVCCFLFGQCIPPEQQQQQRLSSLGFFDWKWQNSTFSVFMLTHQIMWFVIIWTKKGNQTVNDQTNGNIHSEFKKFDQKKTKIERARALSTVSWEVFLECMCVCVSVSLRMKWRFSIVHSHLQIIRIGGFTRVFSNSWIRKRQFEEEKPATWNSVRVRWMSFTASR